MKFPTLRSKALRRFPQPNPAGFRGAFVIVRLHPPKRRPRWHALPLRLCSSLRSEAAQGLGDQMLRKPAPEKRVFPMPLSQQRVEGSSLREGADIPADSAATAPSCRGRQQQDFRRKRRSDHHPGDRTLREQRQRDHEQGPIANAGVRRHTYTTADQHRLFLRRPLRGS